MDKNESSQKIKSLLEDARKRLVETGTRNRLVHVNRSASRANVLNIVHERSDDVFDILNAKSRKMRFKATGKDKLKLDEEDSPALFEELIEQDLIDEIRYTDNQLETLLGPDAQQKRLLRLARDAKTAEEEQGINILYLALGFLTWYEDKSSAVKREAPLILLPVELVRNARTSTYDIKCRDDDIVTNMPLQQRLLDDFGLILPELNVDEKDWTPSHYFKRILEILENRSKWSIDENGMQLGFFSFAKLLMLRDLDPANWPGGGLEDKPLVDGLLASGFQSDHPLFGKNDRLDERLSPAEIIQVVDADASQTKVIEEVRSGRNLIVQGPPGTGKSQTITNIIAAAVHDGKKILFVAEKMAALSVVHKRLKSTGLDDVCLELHSRAANKKQVLAELAITLNAGRAVPNITEAPKKLTKLRNLLNSIADLLHTNITNSEETPFKILAELVHLAGQDMPPPKIDGIPLTKFSTSDIYAIEKLIDVYCQQLGDENQRRSHPLYGVGNLELQPLDIQRLQVSISELGIATTKFSNSATEASKIAMFRQPSFDDIFKVAEFFTVISKAPENAAKLVPLFHNETAGAQLMNALQIGQQWQETLNTEGIKFVESAWTLPVSHLRSSLAAGVGSFFTRFGRAFRSASRELNTLLLDSLPKTAEERVALIDCLMVAQIKRKAFQEQESFLSHTLGPNWYGERTPFAKVLAVGEWKNNISGSRREVGNQTITNLASKTEMAEKISQYLNSNAETILKTTREIFEKLQINIEEAFSRQSLEQVPLHELAAKLESISQNYTRYGDWIKLAGIVKKLNGASLGEIVERIDSGELLPSSAKSEIRYARAEALWEKARNELPNLNQIANLDRHEIVKEFQLLEKQRIKDTKDIVLAKHLGQLPSGSIGEMGIIRGEIGKKRAHKPVRKLMETAGGMIQRIKPVLLMSPISVAQFLPPETLDFDLLVMDEASQVRPEDALGAIARAKQIVVVGDQKQLPPTSFFERMTGGEDQEEDEDEMLGGIARATEMESILSLCEARSVPDRMLEWHYRSRDPSLIKVSNAEFYGNNLVLPPSPLENDDEYGIKLIRVNGVYSRGSRGEGRPATNKIEAQSVVDEIASHARVHPDLSLGVVTFSMAQRNMITEVLEYERRHDTVLDAFLREGRSEDIFVKNIENVQGDERDVILISVGYGPMESGGRLQSMNFGPVNGDGGARRLNVLFSRARVSCKVFCSFNPGDINLARTSKEGPRILKRFLDYADTKILDQPIATGGDADSAFEEDVANEIRKLGYVVDLQVGSAGFLIDLGVKHPDIKGQYMLAVECDGATYHSALWARERDRLRQDVLENLGWQFHRIWSTDWFHRRSAEIERMKNILINATNTNQEGILVEGANSGDLILEQNGDEEKTVDTIEIHPAPTIKCPPYVKAEFRVHSSVEPHEAPLQQLVDIVQKIVGIEGPIHEDEIARRLAAVFGKEKAGRRIVEVTQSALNLTRKGSSAEKLLNSNEFWFTANQQESNIIRNRANLPASIQKAEMISPIEIEAAVQKVLEGSGIAEKDEIIRAVAQLFGFERVGPGLKSVIGKVANNLSTE